MSFETIAIHEAAQKRRGNLYLFALATAVAIVIAAVGIGLYSLR